ncbi:hypothetical protein ACFL34_01845 [Candidatus Sumerlaeota bacterium]
MTKDSFKVNRPPAPSPVPRPFSLLPFADGRDHRFRFGLRRAPGYARHGVMTWLPLAGLEKKCGFPQSGIEQTGAYK